MSLALKYRPKNFNELVGQEEVSTALINALNLKKISNAYLFSGLRGSGKTSSARILAKSLICERGVSASPCEVCDNCKNANANRHLDIIEIDGASHRKIEDIKDIIEQSKYTPSVARYKIFIIDEVHMLTKEAFNALLKTLEEPPEFVVFILATTEVHKIPATILSRTQHFRFNPIAKNKIVHRLEEILTTEGIPYEKGGVEILVRSSSGSMRDNITLLEQGVIYSNNFISEASMRKMLGLIEADKLDELFDVIILNDRKKAINLIKEFENFDIYTLINEMTFYLKDKFLNYDNKFSLIVYERFFRILSECRNLLDYSVDNSYVLMMIVFMMMEALNFNEVEIDLKESKIKDTKQTQIPQQNNQIIEEIPKQGDIFEILKNKIYDRNMDLGKIFEKNVQFISYEDNKLLLNSSAIGEEQEILRKSSKVILSILRSIDESIKIEISSNKIEEKKDDLKDMIMDSLKPVKSAQEFRQNEMEKEKEEVISQEVIAPPQDIIIPSKEEIKNELDRIFGKPKIL